MRKSQFMYYICAIKLILIIILIMEKTEKKRKTTVISYYRLLEFKQKSVFKNRVIEITGWSEPTFSYKMREQNLTKLELEALEQIIIDFKTGKLTWN